VATNFSDLETAAIQRDKELAEAATNSASAASLQRQNSDKQKLVTVLL